MERIKGLNEYVKNEKYRKALNLPNEQEEEYTMLAQGEYNINYSFTHPKTGKKLLLRVNCGSQMHLENQIGYECHALQLLEASGRTPKVLYVDGSRKFLDHGVLVMEYLPGKALDYHTDLKYAASVWLIYIVSEYRNQNRVCSARESTDRNIGRVRRDGEDIYGFTAWKRQDEKENPRFA